MMPFRASSTIQHANQQSSPTSTRKNSRYNMNNKHKRLVNNSLNISTGSGQTLVNTNSNNMARHGGINTCTHNGHNIFRLTNV
jgi:hypothetical protein